MSAMLELDELEPILGVIAWHQDQDRDELRPVSSPFPNP